MSLFRATVCSVMPTPVSHTTAVVSTPVPVAVSHMTAAAIRPSAPHPVLTVRPPTPVAAPVATAASSVVTQRVLLSPDMQARLPCEHSMFYQLLSFKSHPVKIEKVFFFMLCRD